MKVELDEDEVWELMSLVVGRLTDETPLADSDRAKLRRWKSESMRRGSDAVRALTRKVNEDLAQQQEWRRRSPIRKPDWR